MNHILLFLKSIAFGMANLIPGFSGGTIALVTGMYEDLIHNISLTFEKVKSVLSGNIQDIKTIPYFYLATLGGGAILGIAIFTILSGYLLTTLETGFYTFLLGVIVVTAYYLLQDITLDFKKIGLVLTGSLIAVGIYYVTYDITSSFLWLFILGALSVSTLILPGVSGSMILLIFGKYEHMLTILKTFYNNILEVLVFLVGGITGVYVTSRVLDTLLQKYEPQTLSLLTGLMIGGLIVPIDIVLENVQETGDPIQITIGLLIGMLLPVLLKRM